MAADPSSSSAAATARILLNSGIAGICLGASGLLHHFGGHPAASPDARAQAQLFLFFLAFLAGKAMVLYALLLSKGVVPGVSPGLARKLCWIPLAPFLLALAMQVPLLVTTGSMMLRVELVGNGRVAVPGEGEAAGEVLEGDLGGGIAWEDEDGVVAHEAQ